MQRAESCIHYMPEAQAQPTNQAAEERLCLDRLADTPGTELRPQLSPVAVTALTATGPDLSNLTTTPSV